MKFDLGYLEKIAKIVKENDINEITIEDKEKTISIKRDYICGEIKQQIIPTNITSQVVSKPIEKQSENKVEKENKGKPITAPMVGTFYCSPSPSDAPFVQVGDKVSVGQIICIIEAMKLMNEIESDTSGEITEICVKNGDSIESGQVIMYVK